MRKAVSLSWLLAFLLMGCSYYFGIGSEKLSAPTSADGAVVPTSRNSGPCPSSLVIDPQRSARIRGIWLTDRGLPFRMRIAGELQTPPALLDVSEILFVLDDWKTTACRAGLKAKNGERPEADETLGRVDDYLRAFILVLSTPYPTQSDAEDEIRRWVQEVRDRLLARLLRGAG